MFWQHWTHELTDVFGNVERPVNIKLHFQSAVFACGGDEMLEETQYKCSVLNFMGAQRVGNKT